MVQPNLQINYQNNHRKNILQLIKEESTTLNKLFNKKNFKMSYFSINNIKKLLTNIILKNQIKRLIARMKNTIAGKKCPLNCSYSTV